MKNRYKRTVLIVGGVATLGITAALLLNAFQSNLVFFFTPTQVSAGEAPTAQAFRIGGMVQSGSMQRQRDDLTVKFIVTDTAKEMPVVYTGILPDLFREGKGVVAQGRLGSDGIFRAETVLAKHDENYMPPEAQHAMDQAKKSAQTVRP